MAFHDDLFEQAQHLANRERKRPRQASLRRAVSSAYYALFGFLIAEAVSNWKIGAQRPQLARIFEHAKMYAASERVLNVRVFPFTGQDPVVVAPDGRLRYRDAMVKDRGARFDRVGNRGLQKH